MIKKYTIQNFKNHAHTALSLSNLNILTGLNGMGKSSVIQSMLLLRDSYAKNPSMSTLYTDIDSVDIVDSASLVNCNLEKNQDVMHLCIESDACTLQFNYQFSIEDKDTLSAIDTDAPKDIKSCSLFTDDFQYLSAFRSGPQPSYGSSSVVDKHRQMSLKLGMGEFAVYFLHKFQGEDIPLTELMYPDSTSRSLYDQTELWMTEISRGIKFKLDQNGKSVNLSFGYERPGKPTVYHNAMNTGYGVSYILSVIVSILSARPGSLIIVENPESHIHPSGQSALMRMISIAARNGVQFIIETHSDHILNGALVNAKKNVISKDQISVYYFDVDEKLNSNPHLLKIEDNGRIQTAPEGFFDQMDADTEVLFDI